jgi:ribonuclease R
MAKAIYSTDNICHYGLSFDYYTHFTSPIRRYPDMLVHRLLAHYLNEGASADKDKFQELCDHSSEMEQRAADAERDSIKYKMVEFMMDKIDQEFDGFVTNITEWNMFVELDENKIEGLISLRNLTDDYYTFDDDNYRIIGRLRGRTITLGDRVRIKIRHADLSRKLLEFTLIAKYNPRTQQPEYINYE